MVPMDMVVLAMLAMPVLAMLVLAMLAMLDTPMPMVPTATLDKKFFLFLQLHSETIYYPRAYQL